MHLNVMTIVACALHMVVFKHMFSVCAMVKLALSPFAANVAYTRTVERWEFRQSSLHVCVCFRHVKQLPDVDF